MEIMNKSEMEEKLTEYLDERYSLTLDTRAYLKRKSCTKSPQMV